LVATLKPGLVLVQQAFCGNLRKALISGMLLTKHHLFSAIFLLGAAVRRV